MRQAIDEIVLSFDMMLSNSSLSLKLTMHKKCPAIIVCDKPRLQQIIRNLLSNSIRYARSRIELEVEFLPESGVLQVIVTDDGPGFGLDKVGFIIDFMGASQTT